LACSGVDPTVISVAILHTIAESQAVCPALTAEFSRGSAWTNPMPVLAVPVVRWAMVCDGRGVSRQLVGASLAGP
jgi:hypothetical protein